ncbi:MAG TPA: hypothetical protein VNG29_00185 [Candidatus Paceibacterota bacterium]|nr:hypothetical protein [Candidatus Paceibacterota bacterium]
MNKILALLVILFVAGVFWLVALYNASVNLDHGIADMKTELQSVQAQNAALQQRMFGVTSSDNLQHLAARDNLIEDNNPEYFEIHSQWSYASEF